MKIFVPNYRRKKTRTRAIFVAWLAIIFLVIVALHFVTITVEIGFNATKAWAQETFQPVVYAPNKLVSPIPNSTITPTPTESTPSITPAPTIMPEKQKDIENYMRTIFGSDARVAVAISHNECNPSNAKYPECVLYTSAEYSVGVFQINLYNAKQWIHAGRVPGKTMEEKVEWLKNPYNNTLYAYWVFKTSGWDPWTAYTSGNYLRSL